FVADIPEADDGVQELFLLLLLFLLFGLLLGSFFLGCRHLALLQDLGLGDFRYRLGRRHRRLGLARGMRDVYEDALGVVHNRDPLDRRNLRDTERIADRELSDVDREMSGDVSGEALDLDLTGDEIEDSALGFDSLGGADDLDADLQPDLRVHHDPYEIDVHGLAGHRVALKLFDHGVTALVGTAELQQEDRVLPRAFAKGRRERLVIHADLYGGLSRAIDDCRDAAPRAHAPGFALAAGGSLFDVEFDRFHVASPRLLSAQNGGFYTKSDETEDPSWIRRMASPSKGAIESE